MTNKSLTFKALRHRIICAGIVFSILQLAEANTTINVNCSPNPLHANRTIKIWYRGVDAFNTPQQSYIYLASTTQTVSQAFYVPGYYYNQFKMELLNGATVESTQETGALINGSPSWTFNVTLSLPPPSAPIGLSASRGLFDKIRLSWPVNYDTFTYLIYSSTNNISSGAAYLGSTSSTNFDDAASSSVEKYYWIKGQNPSGTSGFSNIATGSFLNAISGISPATRTFAKGGGGGGVTITAEPLVMWTATTNVSWLHITAGEQSGTGNGSLTYLVDPNYTAHTRLGAVKFGTFKQCDITQTGYDAQLSTNSMLYLCPTNSGVVSVYAPAGISWTATSQVPWLQVTSGSSGVSTGTVTYSVSSNALTTERVGDVDIAGKQLTVTQQGEPTVLNMYSYSTNQYGGFIYLGVTALDTTSWEAISTGSWLHVISGGSGSGDGIVTLFADQNYSYLGRGSSIDVHGKVFTVTQSGVTNPVISITSTNGTAPAVGCYGYIEVAATPDAPWSATSSVPWMAMVQGSPGTGTGTVKFAVTVINDVIPRSGSIVVKMLGTSRTQNVNQVGYQAVLSPSSLMITPNNQNTNVGVSLPPACKWTASESISWLWLGASTSGVGPATVNITLSNNISVYSRTGIVSVAGVNMQVIQVGRPALLDSEYCYFDADGNSTLVNVSTEVGSTWAATTADSWISIFSGSPGTGPGGVIYIVMPLSDPFSQRNGVINIAGVNHYVIQSGVSASINPTSVVYSAEGGGLIMDVDIPFGSSWVANASRDWIHITSTPSGMGPDTLSYYVPENYSASRTGVIFVAGQNHTIVQSATFTNVSLPYLWENQFWPIDLSGGGTNDSDHDGRNNWEEWMAGTDPTNANSILRIDGAESSGGISGFGIGWNSMSGRYYSVWGSTNLAGSAWGKLRDWQYSTGGYLSYSNVVPYQQQFIQLRVSPTGN